MQYLLQSCPPSPAVCTPRSASRQYNTSTTATVMNHRMMSLPPDSNRYNVNYSSPVSNHTTGSAGHIHHTARNVNANSSNSSSRMMNNIPIPAAPFKSRSESLNTADFMDHSLPNQQLPLQYQSHNPTGTNSKVKESVNQPCKAPRKRLLLLHSPRKSSSGSLPYGEMLLMMFAFLK